MCRTMSIVNNKGGVGKTTTTLVLAELLAYLNKKVLVIDLDGQSNTTLTLHSYVQESEASINGRVAPIQENIFEVFVDRIREKEKLSKLIYKTNINGVDIIPSSSRFKNIEKNLEECYRSPFILAKAIKVIRDDYDYIIIDNSPAMNFFTLNSIVASDLIITPVRVEEYSKKGVREILDTFNQIKDEYDLDVEFLGVFLTQVNTRTNIYKERIENYREELKEKFFSTVIRQDTKIEQMESKHKPILEISADSNALIDYCNLILEMNILDEKSTDILRASIGVI